MKTTPILAVIALLFVLPACKMADVRPKNTRAESVTASKTEKGRALLDQSIRAMGYDALANLESYEADVVMHWRYPWRLMPLNSLPGAKDNKVRLRFVPNSFDGQIEYLEGRKQGEVHGMQSFRTYAYSEAGEPEFTKDKRRTWGLAAYHYMLEGPFRLINAEIVTYAGSATFEGQEYELVLCTWETAEPHKEHDQWLLYINKETHFVDLANITVRDFFLPFPPNMAEGTVQYLERERLSNGMYFPKELKVQLMSPKKVNKYVYKMSFSNVQFDATPVARLRPFSNLETYGDVKPGAAQ